MRAIDQNVEPRLFGMRRQDFAFRIQREETMMLENFGDEYRVYMRQTKRLVPWVI